MRRSSRVTAVWGVVALCAGLLVTATPVGAVGHQRVRPSMTAPTDPVMVLAGDVACATNDPNFLGTNPATCQARATRSLITESAPATLAPLGDLVYGDASLADFQQSYAPVWGNLGPDIDVRPVVGNHDYGGSHSQLNAASTAQGYHSYFGASANPTGQTTVTGQPVGWYSYDVGTWHVVTLNHECATVGGCGPGSPQESWLAADLAAHPAACTLVLGHEPRWSDIGGRPEYQTIWQRLVAARATLLVSGHDHNYQRFAPRDADGVADANGVRQFVVGTGGVSLEAFPGGATTTEARDAGHYGVLKLTLHSGRYDWQFLTTAGTVTDSGTASCPNATPPVVTPGAVGVWDEGDSGSTSWDLPVTLSNPSDVPVSIDWATVDTLTNPLAHAGSDFVAASGTVTFQPGETTQNISLEILGDTVDEPPLLWGEWGLVSFTNPTNATLDTSGFFGHGLFIIVDDDPTPLITPGTVGVWDEGDSGSNFWSLPVRLSNQSEVPVTIDWATIDNLAAPLAHAGSDFVGASGTVTFQPGETTQNISLEILGDTVDEPPLLWGEWGLVSFTNPTNATLDTSGFFGHGLFIIVDDDP